MPKWLIGVLILLGIILVGVNVYLFYSYFTFKENITKTPTFQTISLELTGEIKPGWQLALDQEYCAKSYYLVSANEIVEIKPSESLIIDGTKLLSSNKDFRRYNNSLVNINGLTQAKSSSSCGDFIAVETLGNLGTNSQPITITGVVSCLPGSEEDCIQSLQIGDAFLALIQNEAVLSNLTVGDTMRVVGVVDNTFESPDNFDAGILVTTIEKI